jgi:tetratricopeptide (TPR) repeat protein
MLLDKDVETIEQSMEHGDQYVKQKNPIQALLYFNKVTLLTPENTGALVGCAKMLVELNRPAEAAIYSARALQLNPTRDILTLHAQILYQLGKYVDALSYFERIIAAEPNNYIALNQRALCLTEVNRHEEALQVYEEAIHLSENRDPWVHYNYSLCLLAMGKLITGFNFFEARWLAPLFTKRRVWIIPDDASIETLHGKSFLIHSEQGLGDSILFFRYVSSLLQFGARVYLEIQPALIPLFEAWRHTITFIAQGSPLPICDYHCPMMSLGRLFKTEIHTIPKPIPYIVPDKNLFESCQKKLEDSKRHRIGIAWKGSHLNAKNPGRSIALHKLLTLYHPNFDFFCLQKDVTYDEKKELEQYNIRYHSLELSSMSGTAALIACLDLVITIDTSIAHLSAAMGKTVWILLPFSADWRWFLDRSNSPWYPNVILFRQRGLNDWSSPLYCIKEALLTFQPIIFEFPVNHFIQQANHELQQGLFLQAEQLYRKILMKDPINAQALHGIALCAFQENKLAEAIGFMQLAIEIAPNVALYRRNFGELLRRVGQLNAAIASLKIVIDLEPKVCENHYLLGLAYNTHQQLDLSIHHYRIALSLNPQHGMAWNNLGASLESMGNKLDAKIAYTKAIHLNHHHAEAQNNLGAIYSEEGLINEARMHFEAAIAANPYFIDAHYNLSLIKTYTSDDPHLSFIESMKSKMKYSAISTRIRYYFTLGKALDDIHQYDRAFESYAEGNRLHFQTQPWNKIPLQNFVDTIPKVFTQSFLKQTKPIKEKRCPIFIVGMPRSGSTLIEQILASHKNIYGAGELSILDEVIQKARQKTNMRFPEWVAQLSDDDFFILGEEYLERTWQLAPDKQYIIDKMPANFFYIGLIYRMLPTAKIIHAIRDPMDSCFSCFTHLFNNTMTFAYDLIALGNYYVLYAKTMQHWRSILPEGAMFDVCYEQMVNDYEALSKKIMTYLGLPWDPNCLHFYNNHRVVKTASLTQVRKPIYKTSMQRWQHFSTHLEPLLHIVAPYRYLKGISM